MITHEQGRWFGSEAKNKGADEGSEADHMVAAAEAGCIHAAA